MAKKDKSLKLYPQQIISLGYKSDMADKLRELEKQVGEKVLRSAAYAGAKVLYREMKRRVPVRTGELYESIYHYHVERLSGETRQVYDIGPNKQKAGHWHWVEYGNVRMAAQPYVRPTWETKKNEALRAMRDRFREKMAEIPGVI